MEGFCEWLVVVAIFAADDPGGGHSISGCGGRDWRGFGHRSRSWDVAVGQGDLVALDHHSLRCLGWEEEAKGGSAGGDHSFGCVPVCELCWGEWGDTCGWCGAGLRRLWFVFCLGHAGCEANLTDTSDGLEAVLLSVGVSGANEARDRASSLFGDQVGGGDAGSYHRWSGFL